MNIFDLFKELFFKSSSVDCRTSEGLQMFSPYMINRWLSFYGKPQAQFVNDTLNKYSNVLDEKVQQYNMYYHLIPKMKFKRISYVKKSKSNDDEKVEHLNLLASNLNISTRELKQYMELYKHIGK